MYWLFTFILGKEYTVLETRQVTFNAFPVSIRGCGREMSCFWQCCTSPTCPLDESSYMVVMTLTPNKKNVIINLGGIVENEEVNVVFVFFLRAKFTTEIELPTSHS